MYILLSNGILKGMGRAHKINPLIMKFGKPNEIAYGNEIFALLI